MMIDSAAGLTSAPPRPWIGREGVDDGGDREDCEARHEEAAAAPLRCSATIKEVGLRRG